MSGIYTVDRFSDLVYMPDFFYASSDENAVLAQAFEEHRDHLRNLQHVFLMVVCKSIPTKSRK